MAPSVTHPPIFKQGSPNVPLNNSSNHHHHQQYQQQQGVDYGVDNVSFNQQSTTSRNYLPVKQNVNYPSAAGGGLKLSPDVEVRRDDLTYQDEIGQSPRDNGVNGTAGTEVIVRGEEIGIVIVVLLLWVGAIILFFNRWGKIRMLEPYQPKFCENHRPSCPMADVNSLQNYPRTYSKFNISTDMLNSTPQFAKCNYHGVPAAEPSTSGLGLNVPGPGYIRVPGGSRPRQNSVFVTSPLQTSIALNSVAKSSSRKTKSAIDLSTLVLSEEFMENVRRHSKNSITHL